MKGMRASAGQQIHNTKVLWLMRPLLQRLKELLVVRQQLLPLLHALLVAIFSALNLLPRHPCN